MSTTQHETTTPNYLKETSTHGAYTLIIIAKPVPTRGYKTTPNQITYEVVAGIQDKTHATRNLVSLEVSVEIPNKNPEKLRNVSLLLAERASGLLSQSDNKAYAALLSPLSRPVPPTRGTVFLMLRLTSQPRIRRTVRRSWEMRSRRVCRGMLMR